jgi:hypothetical protein
MPLAAVGAANFIAGVKRLIHADEDRGGEGQGVTNAY